MGLLTYLCSADAPITGLPVLEEKLQVILELQRSQSFSLFYFPVSWSSYASTNDNFSQVFLLLDLLDKLRRSSRTHSRALRC